MREQCLERLLSAGQTWVYGGDRRDAWWERKEVLLGDRERKEILRRPGDGFGEGRHVENNILLDVAELLQLRAWVSQRHTHERVQRNRHRLVP